FADDERVEQAHLDLRVQGQSGQLRIQTRGATVIQQQPDPYPSVRRRVQLLQQQGAGHVAVPDVVLHVQGALCSPGQQHPRRECAVRVGEGVDAALVGVCRYFGGQGLAEAGGAGALGIQGDGFGQVLRRQTATGKQADTEQQGGQPSVRLGESEVQHGGDLLAWPPARGQDRAVYPANGGAKKKPLGTVIARGYLFKQSASDVESEVHHIPVLDDVFLAFQAPFTGFLGTGFAVVLDEVIVGHHFGADEALLEVGVDDRGGLGSGGADLDGPGADFLDPGGKIRLQVEQFVTGADHPVQARLIHADGFEEHILLFTIVEFGDFRFDLVAHRHHDRALGVGDAAYDIQIGVVVEAVLGDVGDVHDRLAGQQMEALDQLLLVIGQVLHQRAGWFALAEMRDEFLQQRLLGYSFLVAALGVTRYALQLLLATVEVREDQFQIDNLDIALGVDA